MKITLILCGVLVLVALARSNPIEKREADDELSPLNEVYIVETEGDPALEDDRSDRDKRKIGVIKLGVTNGIINFVFGKLDSFLDSKTKALAALDEANKVKNAAFGIDASQSATTQFISNLVSSKIQAATGSIGPVVNSATTFLQGATSGLTGAFVSKLAPLSSLSGGLAGGLNAGAGASAGGGGSVGGGVSAGTTGSGAGILGSLLASKVGSLSSLSQGSGTGGSTGAGGSAAAPSGGAGINLGAFANLGGGETISTTTEDIPEFDRTRVSLDVPPAAFGSGFTLVTNVSKILSSVILNSARRTQTFLELFKPFFRGIFAIKGLPSDNPQ